MNGFYSSFSTEIIKVRRSKIFWITLGIFAFIAIMLGMLVFFAMHPELIKNSAIMSAKATIIGPADWPAYFLLLYQMVAMLGLIGFGFVASWLFGREYSDHTLKDLLSLPVSRTMIVLAKYLVMVIWSLILSLILYGIGLVSGLLAGIENWSVDEAVHAFIIFMVTGVLTILVSTPVAFFASWGKGYLLPIGYIILSMIITQLIIAGFPGLTPYFPWVIPALYSGAGGPESGQPGLVSYIILGLTCIVGVTGTAAWWRYADHT
jgi:ABC-2 type transport system permease protein